MTPRQEFLKDEIIRVSDILQLGIRQDDKDWFYMFMQRMDEIKMEDRRWHRDLQRLEFLSFDFLKEFKSRINLSRHYVYGGNRNIPIDYLIDSMSIKYLCGSDYSAIIELGKDEKLTDELVVKYEKVFDDTHGRCGNNAVPDNINTAWYFILRNKSISESLKERYKDKPQVNEYSMYGNIKHRIGEKDNSKDTTGFCCSVRKFFT